ncbi:hypothetical protein ABMA27_015076 [Loxostege sticticalis]|uniref:Reverse transcriptase domain-containing protein n=1 Tax=Loxostege sticticalis TaxID=481309 RepID=A0ABR3I6C3_LOXSC
MEKYATQPSPAMTQTIQDLLNQDIIRPVTERTPSFISKLFLRKKSNGTMRPIFDLRELNKFVKTKHFRLISHSVVPEFLQPGDWMIKLDISQAYFHVPMARSHRVFLRISFQGELYEMTCLPFGLSSAPHIFASVTCWVAETLRAKGCRVLVYLDDFLLVHQDHSKLCLQAAEAVRHLENLGWIVNYQKSILTPTQDLEYLGIRWVTSTNTMALPGDKVSSLNMCLDQYSQMKEIKLRQLQSLLGQLNFANFVIPRGRLHCRHLQLFLHQFDKKRPRQTQPIPELVHREITWWRKNTEQSIPIHIQPASHFMASDASDQGWGAQIDGDLIAGTWSKQQKRWHSNKKELFAVIAALKKKANELRNTHVLIQSDNRTLISYIRKEGGTRSIALLDLTFQLLDLTDRFKITLSAFYLPGRYNIIADRLSRGKQPAEWHLLPQATAEVFQKWGHPEIDLFASQETAVVPNYVSIDCRDRSANYTDAFSRPWKYQLAWVFPPPNMIPRVLMHLNQAKGTYLIVAPEWPQAFWLQDLKSRCLDHPHEIQNLSECLIDMTTSLPPPQVQSLSLKVWKTGGGEKN